jgi:hypothetical protein
MRSALRISVEIGWFMRLPAHHASVRPIASAMPPIPPATNSDLRIWLRCIASKVARATADSGELSIERISISTSPTVCGENTPGIASTFARTGAVTRREMLPLVSGAWRHE